MSCGLGFLDDRAVTRAPYGHAPARVNDSNNAKHKPKQTQRDLPGYATTQFRNAAIASTREENAVWTDFYQSHVNRMHMAIACDRLDAKMRFLLEVAATW